MGNKKVDRLKEKKINLPCLEVELYLYRHKGEGWVLFYRVNRSLPPII